MNPMFWPPPAVSEVVSFWTPGSPLVPPSGTRTVVEYNSACLVLGCSTASARPVIGTMPPGPPLSVYSTLRTVNVLASGPWPLVRPVLNVPVQPVCWERPCECWSCPSEIVTCTSLHEIPAPVVPSSGSETEIVYGTVSVNAATWPLAGVWIVITGVRLPTVIGTFATAVLLSASLTVSLAVYAPLEVYVCDGFASVESIVPLPSKSHAYVSAVFSGSLEPALEKFTASGARPVDGVPLALATGALLPAM